jgi:predicted GTPase
MNSGRLRDGAETFRRFTSAALGIDDAASPPPPVKLLLMGQAKAGKSSLINALLGERASKVDVLPCTDEIRSYSLTLEDQSTGLTLLDSPGYSETGLTKNQARQLQQAAREADVILLVMAAHQPAREADRLALEELRHWYAGHPELKLPPVIAVLTHIHRLSPSLEWSPPYQWMKPVSKKEQSIRGAVDYAREVFQNAITVAIPVRTDESHVQGIQEELLPTISRLLPESQAGLMLRVLHIKLSQDRFKAVLDQSLSAGRTLLQNWLTLNRP